MANTHEIYLAGGCFWGMQAYLDKFPGVIETEVGYANGTTEAPTYEEVCSGETHHAETVHVTYDADVISLPLLLTAYLEVIDPTSINKQGEDEGEQYRTGIWWADPADEATVEEVLDAAATALPRNAGPMVVQTGSIRGFWLAEDYHQKYLDNNPCGYCHVDLGDADAFIEKHRAEFGA